MIKNATLEKQEPLFVILETAFGEITVHKDTIINFPQEILGFTACHYFSIMSVPGHTPESQHRLLQSLEQPKLCLIITPISIGEGVGQVHEKDVLPYIEEHHLALPEVSLWSILAFDRTQSDHVQVTANLKAPLLIDPKTQQGWQIILYHSDYPVNHPLAID